MNVDFNHTTCIYSKLSDTLILIAIERRKAIIVNQKVKLNRNWLSFLLLWNSVWKSLFLVIKCRNHFNISPPHDSLICRPIKTKLTCFSSQFLLHFCDFFSFAKIGRMFNVGKIFAVLRKISNCPEDMHQFFRNNLLTFSETFQPLCKKDTKGVDESHDAHLPSSHKVVFETNRK